MLLTTDYMQCSWCKHKHDWSRGKTWTCDVFPDGAGIPDQLSMNLHIHTTPYPGDRGILFEWREGAEGAREQFYTYGEIYRDLMSRLEQLSDDELFDDDSVVDDS